MRLLLLGLLCLTLVTHLGFSLLPGMTPARWFYVLRGAEGAILFLSLSLLPVRGLSKLLLASLILAGATMEALTAICGLAFYWGRSPAPARS